MKNCFIIYIVFSFFSSNLFAQQDVHFAQFYEVPMLRNPSLAGIFNGKIRFTAAYRNQWQSITVPYRTMALGAEIKIFKGFNEGDLMTMGLQITNDIAGDSKLQRTQVLPVLNYHKLLNEEHTTLLSLAFMGGLVSQRFDPSALKFDDQFVGGNYSATNMTNQTFSNTGFSYWDASTGLSFSSFIHGGDAKFYLGAALFHFNKPSLKFITNNDVILNKKWGLNGGITMKINTDSKLVIYADHFEQGGDKLTQAGFLYSKNFLHTEEDSQFAVSAGAVFRLHDAIIPTVKINTNKCSVGFSYDTNISSLRTASNLRGGFEMTLTYIDPWNSFRDNNETNKTKCPANVW
jgi:type IX secretion system PorP/SprF family membrane protein